jgi:hypothetical protein
VASKTIYISLKAISFKYEIVERCKVNIYPSIIGVFLPTWVAFAKKVSIMKKASHFLIFSLCLAVISGISLTGCSNDTDDTGDPPTIDPALRVIIFRTPGQSDVTFTHQAHADYYDNTCMVCHMHTDVRDDTIWSCSECHANNDSDGLCVDDAWGHNCMFVQCQDCHLQQTPDPTPNCTDCHDGAIVPPPPGGQTFTIYGSIDASTQVDHYYFQLTTPSDVTIDVASYEETASAWGHGSVDLNLPIPNNPNGANNDKLLSNIYLFTAGGTLMGSVDGQTICICSGCHFGGWKDNPGPGWPGCDASGIIGTYGINNPTLSVTGLAAGDYFVAIGAQYMSSAEAQSANNNSGDESGWSGIANNNYKIIITITPN